MTTSNDSWYKYSPDSGWLKINPCEAILLGTIYPISLNNESDGQAEWGRCGYGERRIAFAKKLRAMRIEMALRKYVCGQVIKVDASEYKGRFYLGFAWRNYKWSVLAKATTIREAEVEAILVAQQTGLAVLSDDRQSVDACQPSFYLPRSQNTRAHHAAKHRTNLCSVEDFLASLRMRLGKGRIIGNQ